MGEQYYDKPKYELMKDYLLWDMNLQKGQIFAASKFISDFQKKYPKFGVNGIKMSLSRLSVNDSNRKRYNPTERDDVLWKIDGHTYRRYDKDKDAL
ncbi:MAG: hypothetical protein Ta2A_22630 [Treponemataceae bacterium]|nr:MAG: hypothetical protein Ta2A_22630 [Treponemataceae bacterium]